MKIVICSDAHTDARCCGVERYDELAEAFERVDEYATMMKTARHDVLAVFCGDLCDGDDGRDVLRASSLAISHARMLEFHDVSQQLWLSGNHDVLGDGSTTLDPLAEAVAGFGYVARTQPMKFDIVEAGELIAEVLALPYSPQPYDAEQALATFLEETKKTPQRLVFSHLMLPGQHPGSESAEMARGKDRMFPVGLLKTARRVTVVNGHYHAGGVGPAGILIPGSMARLTFGEQDNQPGFLVLDVSKDGVKVERVPFSGARQVLTIWRDLKTPAEFEACAGAFVRVEPPANADPDEVARVEKMARDAGALAVKVLGTRRDAVSVEPAVESVGIERRSTRDVVLAMCADAVSRDRAALRESVEGVLEEAGL